METVGYILALVTWVWLWDQKTWPYISKKKNTLGYEYRNDLVMFLDIKPINCGTCLAFWSSLWAFHIVGDWYLFTIPIVYQLLTRILK